MSGMAPAPVTAVIPLKALPSAKMRLAPALSRERRRELAEEMFAHVLGTCLAAAAVAEVLVVAGDQESADLAALLGARAVVQHETGLNAALAHADELLAGARTTLVVAADLPLLNGEDLDVLCGAAPDGPAVVVAPTWDGGTGALLRRPGTVIPTAYGLGSAAAHQQLAARAGVTAVLVQRDGFSFDVDTAEQLEAAIDRGAPLHAWLDDAVRG
jgi:2-phospho-L-lactate/phosphoenolpyruvate guanylyltransferase